VQIVDTGALLALVSVTDNWHDRCAELVDRRDWNPIIPTTVLSELDYFLTERLPSAARVGFFTAVRRGAYRVEEVLVADVWRAFDVCIRHLDQKISFVDASVLAVAERLNVETVITTDRRDFRTFAPKHCLTLDLWPDGPDTP
jgi:uncharacterized protein